MSYTLHSSHYMQNTPSQCNALFKLLNFPITLMSALLPNRIAACCFNPSTSPESTCNLQRDDYSPLLKFLCVIFHRSLMRIYAEVTAFNLQIYICGRNFSALLSCPWIWLRSVSSHMYRFFHVHKMFHFKRQLKEGWRDRWWSESFHFLRCASQTSDFICIFFKYALS